MFGVGISKKPSTLPVPKEAVFEPLQTDSLSGDQQQVKVASDFGNSVKATKLSSAAISPTSTINTPSPAPAPIGATAQAAAQATAVVTAFEFTEQDRAALQSFSQTSTRFILAHERLNEVVLIVAAHEHALHQLVSKVKECPSLFWFYPKKRELRNWLSNPAKCLFQDTLMMVVVCPVTLCVVQCGPEGVGWEVSMPKKWVQKWGPAIMVSIYVMQAAVLAGRVVGIPLPQLPSVANITGLSSTVLGAGVNDVANQENMMKCLTEFASTTAAMLDQQSPEMKDLLSNILGQKKRQPLPEDKVKLLTDDAYKSMHTFLTTGDNAKLGRLEKQLRGRMERVMAPNGDIEWVSVEGRDLWLEQRKRLSAALPDWNAKRSAPPSVSAAVASPRTPLSVITPTTPTTTATTTTTTSTVASSGSGSWLAARLSSRGTPDAHIRDCETKLVVEEGFTEEDLFTAMHPTEFTAAYLTSIGITARGLQIQLHNDLCAQQPHTCIKASLQASDYDPASAGGITPEELAIMRGMQSTIQDLTSQLSKLRASVATVSINSTSRRAPRGDGSGGGGLALQQVQATANAINPRTRLPYTVDELSEEIFRLQREVARHDRDIGNVAAATEERLDDLQQSLVVLQQVHNTTTPTTVDLEDVCSSLMKKKKKSKWWVNTFSRKTG